MSGGPRSHVYDDTVELSHATRSLAPWLPPLSSPLASVGLSRPSHAAFRPAPSCQWPFNANARNENTNSHSNRKSKDISTIRATPNLQGGIKEAVGLKAFLTALRHTFAAGNQHICDGFVAGSIIVPTIPSIMAEQYVEAAEEDVNSLVFGLGEFGWNRF